jgi:hypothetical protein
MSKKNTKAPEASTQTKPESSLDGLTIQAPKTFKGIFRAWTRQVTDREDPTKKITRLKCVCQVPTNDPDVKVDITAWISESIAEAAGIKPSVAFVGTFAYTGVKLESERGQYNEERSLTNATLVAID